MSVTHLKNINSDPAMTGMIKKALKQGNNIVGKESKDFKPDIIVSGVGIAQKHCLINYDAASRQTCLYPNQESEKHSVKVNGALVESDKVFLQHGDRILIGTHHYYLYTDPAINPDLTYDWEAAMKEANADQMNLMGDSKELEEM